MAIIGANITKDKAQKEANLYKHKEVKVVDIVLEWTIKYLVHYSTGVRRLGRICDGGRFHGVQW